MVHILQPHLTGKPLDGLQSSTLKGNGRVELSSVDLGQASISQNEATMEKAGGADGAGVVRHENGAGSVGRDAGGEAPRVVNMVLSGPRVLKPDVF